MRLTFVPTTAAALGMPGGEDLPVEQAHLHDAPSLEEAFACYRRLFGLGVNHGLSVRTNRSIVEIDVDHGGVRIVRIPNHPVTLSSAMVMHR